MHPFSKCSLSTLSALAQALGRRIGESENAFAPWSLHSGWDSGEFGKMGKSFEESKYGNRMEREWGGWNGQGGLL